MALLACTGLRIGEALALRVVDIKHGGRIIEIRQNVDRGVIQETNTQNRTRDVDVPAEFAELLSRYAADQSGYLFAAETGQPWSQRNALDTLAARFGKGGFHRLRRFRAERLREAGVSSDLERYWIGHSRRGLSDLYAAGLLQNAAYRREWCAKVGVGFSLATLMEHNGTQSQKVTEEELAVASVG